MAAATVTITNKTRLGRKTLLQGTFTDAGVDASTITTGFGAIQAFGIECSTEARRIRASKSAGVITFYIPDVDGTEDGYWWVIGSGIA